MQPCLRWVGMDRGVRRDTAKNRTERKKREKEKAKVKERKEKGGEKSKGKNNNGNGSWWNEQREQRWTEPFRGYCGHCSKWCQESFNAINGKDDVRWNLVQWYRTSRIAIALTPDPMYRNGVQAVNSSPVPLACWSTAAVDVDEDWPEEWYYDWESDWMEEWPEDWFWHNPEEYTSEWHDGESSYLVCLVAGSNPNLEHCLLCGFCERLRDRRFREGEAVGHPGSDN